MAKGITVACDVCGNLFAVTVEEIIAMPEEEYDTFGQQCPEDGGLYGSLD
jgi:hypothetical protein